jgi:DNA repair ATPase RecN
MDIDAKLDKLIENDDKLDEIIDSMDRRFSGLEATVKELSKFLYGNGTPGVGEQLRDVNRRLGEIESFERSCPVMNLVSEIDAVRKRHDLEDKVEEEIVKEIKEDQEKEEDSARKFRWDTLALAVGLALNLIISLLHEFIK